MRKKHKITKRNRIPLMDPDPRRGEAARRAIAAAGVTEAEFMEAANIGPRGLAWRLEGRWLLSMHETQLLERLATGWRPEPLEAFWAEAMAAGVNRRVLEAAMGLAEHGTRNWGHGRPLPAMARRVLALLIERPLWRLRLDCGWRGRDIAKLLGIPEPRLVSYERGARAAPPELVERLEGAIAAWRAGAADPDLHGDMTA